MHLQSAKNLRILNNKERVPKNSVCYGLLTDGRTDWVLPGKLAGKKWKRHALNSPSIVVTMDKK